MLRLGRGGAIHVALRSADNEYFQAPTLRRKSQTAQFLCQFGEAPLSPRLPLAGAADTCPAAPRRAAAAGSAPSSPRCGQPGALPQGNPRPPLRGSAPSPTCSGQRSATPRQAGARRFGCGEKARSCRRCLCRRPGRGAGAAGGLGGGRAAAHRGKAPGLRSRYSGLINLRVKRLFAWPPSLPWAAFSLLPIHPL